jgi:hypothetical protein
VALKLLLYVVLGVLGMILWATMTEECGEALNY